MTTPAPSPAAGKTRRLLFLVLLVAVLGLLIWLTVARLNTRKTPPPTPPVPVLTTQVGRQDVPVYAQGVGTVQAFKTVTVRAQVSGQLLKVPFVEGQAVKRGDLLALIDPTTYRAAYHEAVAKKAQDEAVLANALRDLARYEELAKTNYTSHQQADTQRATVAQTRALILSDQAAIENAKAMLDYCTITAPVDGRTGIRQVDEGNIISPSDTTGVVVVTQTQPIAVIFTLPQQQLAQVMAATQAGSVPVTALASDNTTVLDQGTLAVVDNQIDQATGTLKLKAIFPNAAEKLWPGAFVNVRLRLATLNQALVVPSAAVQQGNSGPYVFVIKPDATVTQRRVSLIQADDAQAVIGQGLKAGERVVTSGFVQLKEGSKVTLGGQRAHHAGRPLAPQAP